LIDACRLVRISPNAISPFAEVNGVTHRVVGVFRPLGDLVPEDDSRLILQFDRNLNYRALLSEAEQDTATPPESAVAEYTFPSGNWGHVTHVQLDIDSCRAFVAEAVSDFVEQHSGIFKPGARVVVGTSGGGDSNALLSALAHATSDKDVTLLPVMLLGIPEWDQAVDRAEQLCKELGFDLTLVSSDEVNAALGRPAHAPDWFGDFKQAFPLEDSDVIDTLAIRLALSRVAREREADCLVTGLNLEDLLAECFLRIMQGKQPLEFPVRHLDDVTFCYPVYKVPKKILDGCHPKFSLQNYKERSIGVMMGRGIPYLLAQAMNTLIPGVEFDLVEGFASLVHERPEASPTFGFATISGDEVPGDLRQRWSDYADGRE
ncbi:MAG: hypothetical protein ACRD4I_01570, partial [Candidatus Angelobacter sp.]